MFIKPCRKTLAFTHGEMRRVPFLGQGQRVSPLTGETVENPKLVAKDDSPVRRAVFTSMFLIPFHWMSGHEFVLHVGRATIGTSMQHTLFLPQDLRCMAVEAK